MKNCRKFLTSKIVGKLFVILLVILIITSFSNEWGTSLRIERATIANQIVYKSMVQNTLLLNRCYVSNPNENYCFSVLKTISYQMNNANVDISDVKSIWVNCYIYLSSIALKKYPKLHELVVNIAINERVIKNDAIDFIPGTLENINFFQQELRAEYRYRIQIELQQKLETLNNIKEENENKKK